MRSSAEALLARLDPAYAAARLWDRLGFRPQGGPQTAFLASDADITVYGGAAGGGKTFGELLDPLQFVHVPGFGAVIFRRTTVQVRAEGGLWDESEKIYPLLDAVPREDRLEWRFPNGNSICFAHMEYEKNRFDWQGAQICLIAFDELTHFTKKQFFYMLSRNRSTCGVKPRIRATCNPDADSWVAEFIAWWIGPDGFPIPERSGVLRWFVQDGDSPVWGDSPDELRERFPDRTPLSVTFIPARLDDNPALNEKDPSYRKKLMGLSRVERERLLAGNWKVRQVAGMYFRREWFEVVDVPPGDIVLKVRAWDRAATAQKETGDDPDWTVGVLYGMRSTGEFCVLDVTRDRLSSAGNERLISSTARLDGASVPIFMEQEPGSSGKDTISHYARHVLRGFVFLGVPSGDSKPDRAKVASAAAENGLISMVRAGWNTPFVSELENFPDGGHDDQVDALSLAHNMIVALAETMGQEGDRTGTLLDEEDRVTISPI